MKKVQKLFDYLHQEARKKKISPPNKKKNKNKQLSRLKTINHNDTPNRIYQHI